MTVLVNIWKHANKGFLFQINVCISICMAQACLIDENFKNTTSAETLKKQHQEPVEFVLRKGELHSWRPGKGAGSM